MNRKKTKVTVFTLRNGLTLLALVVLPFVIQGSWNMYLSFERVKLESEKSAQKYNDLVARRDSVESRLESVSTRIGMEREIRQRFDVGLPGEELLVVIEPKKEVEEITPLKVPWWQEWYQSFRSLFLSK